MMRDSPQAIRLVFLYLITRASDELAAHTNLDQILVSVNDNLTLAQKKDLMLMVLSVISADNQKDAGEMKLLAALIEGLNIPDKIMSNVCDQNFEGK